MGAESTMMATIAGSRRLPRVLLAAAVALVVASWVLFALAAPAHLPEDVGFDASWVLAVFAISFSLVGALIASRRPRNAIGWLFLVEGLLWGLMIVGQAAGAWALVAGEGPRVLGEGGAWTQGWVWFPVVALPATLLLLLFPDGRPDSPFGRWLLFATTAGIAVGTLGSALAPWRDETFRSENPIGLPGVAGDLVTAITVTAIAFVVVCSIACGAAMVIRFRRSRGEEASS